MGHRHYDASLGRFLNRDPIGFAGGLNLFSYANGNPTTLTDHTGLKPEHFMEQSIGFNYPREAYPDPRPSRSEAEFVAGFNPVIGTGLSFRDFVQSPGLITGGVLLVSLVGLRALGIAGKSGSGMLRSQRAGGFARSSGDCSGMLSWSSKKVAAAAKKLRSGANELVVSTRAQVEELFLRLYQGYGYRNTTGFGGGGRGVREFFGSKRGTYHWDDLLDESGRVSGHGAGNVHGELPHIQIHDKNTGGVTRIFYGGE